MISEIENHNQLIEFYTECGLEFQPSGYVGTPVLSFIIGNIENIVAAVTVTIQNENVVIDDLAVRKDYRNNGYGEILLLEALKKIKALKKYEDVYVITKEPNFFLKYGFTQVERSNAPDFSICFQCEQYQKECFPAPMKLHISTN